MLKLFFVVLRECTVAVKDALTLPAVYFSR